MPRRFLRIRRFGLVWAGFGFSFLTVAILGGVLFAERHNTAADTPDIGFIAIDMKTAGNTTSSCSGEGCAPGTLGTWDSCVEIDVSSNPTAVIDIVVDAVPSSVGASGAGPNISGFDIDLLYPASRLQILSADVLIGMEYAGTPGGAHSNGTDPLPDTDGDFHMVESDLGPTGESGKGILVRLTIQGFEPNTEDAIYLQHTASGGGPRIFDNSPAHNIYTIGRNYPSLVAFSFADHCPTTPTPTPLPTFTPGPGDGDGDGVPDVSDNCPSWRNPLQSTPTWPIPAGDADCDGFRDTVGGMNAAPETAIGTDPLIHCAQTAGSDNDPPPDVWPADFNDDRAINGQDTGKFGGMGGAFNHLVSDGPFNGILGERFDFSGNGAINGQDTGKYQFYYNKTCAPVGP